MTLLNITHQFGYLYRPNKGPTKNIQEILKNCSLDRTAKTKRHLIINNNLIDEVHLKAIYRLNSDEGRHSILLKYGDCINSKNS